ncbi:hypothetical protein [Pseudomonas sp. ICMP 561]|uniref:hypothetical protein n=1 Tax=Pseudomonas sp. ICMP 561 TaxID=1718918 RepID=UPI000C07333C|nr:hypothetical protein [Pseudomonas sp. ICMP 561]PHN28985.1 hypothetical protein AO242_26230 [Pseudomonas sp. ICMP 561]
MKIILSPVRREETISVVKRGDVLFVNGEEFDFSPVGEGDTLPRSAIDSIWFGGPVDRVDGELTLTMILPLPGNFSPEQAFPTPLLNVPDGDVWLPQPLALTASEDKESTDEQH